MNNLRKTIKSMRDELNTQVANDLSNQIFNNLLTLDIFNYQNFFVYKSFRNEVSTKKLIDFLTAKNKTVAYPVTNSLDMWAGVPNSDSETKSKFGVDEPKDYFILDNIDACFVPLVVADENKNRLGFGKVYYDRFLSKNPCLKIGLAYEFQVVRELSPNPWDVPLDIIVTEKRIIR